jgi:hypothetical protein
VTVLTTIAKYKSCDYIAYIRLVRIMFSRILTDAERKRIRSYLKQDGKKEVLIRQLVSRARRQVPTIRSDLELLEKLLQAYAVK